MILEKFLFLRADAPQDDGLKPLVPVAGGPSDLTAGVDYVKFSILGRNVRTGFDTPFQSNYPCIHFSATNSKDFDFQTFLAPEFLGNTSKEGLDRVLQLGDAVLGPIPYRSDLQLEFGLYKAKATDRLDQLFAMLNDLGVEAAVPFASLALPYARLLKSGVDRAFGEKNGLSLKVGLRSHLGENLSSGEYVLFFDGRGGLKSKPLFLSSDGSSVRTEKGKAVGSAPFIVFKIDKLNWRDDWSETPNLQPHWQAVRDASAANDVDGFEAAIGQFKRACTLSEDLCRDQVNILKRFADEVYDSALDTFTGYESLGGDGLVDLDPGNLASAFDTVFESLGDESDSAAGFEALDISGKISTVRSGSLNFLRRVGETAGSAAVRSSETISRTTQNWHNFERTMHFVRKWEGGFVDDPDDPGGRTNKGITQKTYDGWRAKKGLLAKDVLHITDDEVDQIYFNDYWQVSVKPSWPYGVGAAVFDAAVNMGPRRAIKMLQQAVNETIDRHGIAAERLGCDGIAGSRTQRSLKACLGSASTEALTTAYLNVRRGVYHGIVKNRPRSQKYLKGWLNRVNDLERHLSGAGYESVLESIAAERTHRLPDLDELSPLEAPLPQSEWMSVPSSTQQFEAAPSITVAELRVETLAIANEDDAEAQIADIIDLVEQVFALDYGQRDTLTVEILKCLKAARAFHLVFVAASEAERANIALNEARKFRGQAQIELGLLDEAVLTFDSLLNNVAQNDPLFAEAKGLRGRALKDKYIASIESDQLDREALLAAISAYYTTYERAPSENLWHGINAVALLCRSDRDNLNLLPDVPRIGTANAIIAAAKKRIQTADKSNLAWDYATIAEAHVALKDWAGADEYLAKYVDTADEPFQLNSTLRQFKEIWQLDHPSQEPGAQQLVADLHFALSRLKDAYFEIDAHDFEALERYRNESVSSEVGKSATSNFEVNVDGILPEGFEWVDRLAEIGRSIARIDSLRGNAKGTGFLVDGESLFGPPASGRHFMITNEHVISESGRHPSIQPESARIYFTRFPNEDGLRVKTVVWSSPREQHDCTIVELESVPAGSRALKVEDTALPAQDEAGQVTVIGHPGGRPLSLAIENLGIVEHEGPGEVGNPRHIRVRYTASTEGGSSGSPVFDWRTLKLIALHHMGGKFERFAGQGASHEATPSSSIRSRSRYHGRRRRAERVIGGDNLVTVNQGVWIESIRRALKAVPPKL